MVFRMVGIDRLTIKTTKIQKSFGELCMVNGTQVLVWEDFPV
jgi:hypothetical protein